MLIWVRPTTAPDNQAECKPSRQQRRDGGANLGTGVVGIVSDRCAFARTGSHDPHPAARGQRAMALPEPDFLDFLHCCTHAIAHTQARTQTHAHKHRHANTHARERANAQATRDSKCNTRRAMNISDIMNILCSDILEHFFGHHEHLGHPRHGPMRCDVGSTPRIAHP
jgi:hypothetical protein